MKAVRHLSVVKIDLVIEYLLTQSVVVIVSYVTRNYCMVEKYQSVTSTNSLLVEYTNVRNVVKSTLLLIL